MCSALKARAVGPIMRSMQAESAGGLVLHQYEEYLKRFAEKLGDCEYDRYVKFGARLVKKLRFEEFSTKWKELVDIEAEYADILVRGDTINDFVVKLLRERRDEFLLDRKV